MLSVISKTREEHPSECLGLRLEVRTEEHDNVFGKTNTLKASQQEKDPPCSHTEPRNPLLSDTDGAPNSCVAE